MAIAELPNDRLLTGSTTRDAGTDAVALGRDARPLFGARWNDLWEVPLTEVRARFGVPPSGVVRTLFAAAA